MSDSETPSSQPTTDETSHGQPESGSPEWTRRNFIYGSAAAAAGAVMFRGIARPPVHPAGHGISGLSRGHVVTDQSSPWTLANRGPQVTGTNSITLTLGTDGQASTPGSLVVAMLLSTAGGTPFTAPSGWQSAGAVEVLSTSSSPGRLEIWYYIGTPGSQTAVTTATFTSSGGACRGCMSNFTLPPNTEFVLLDAVGQGTSNPADLPQATFGPTVASWNVANDLGIVVAGDFFSGSPSGNWTTPSGYTFLRVQGGISASFGVWYDLGLSGTAVQAPSLQYSTTSSQLGWGALFAAFRAVAFQPVYLTGGEMATMAALDPSGQQLIMAGDVEGMFRSADFGNTWQLSQSQLYGQNWNNACVAWSLLESGTVVYVCTGNESASSPNTNGGLLVSTDGGITWSLRSDQVQFNGNDVPSQSDSPPGPRPSGEPGDDDRSVGHLLAQDTVGQYLYAATFNGGAGTTYVGGVARSNASYDTPNPAGPIGTNWQSCGFVGSPPGLPASNFYPRALALNTSTAEGANKELWVGTWDSTFDGTYGGVWYCSNAQTASEFSDWVQMPGFPTSTGSTHAGSVSDLKVLDGYLYATCTTMGIFRWEIGGSSNEWTSLNVTPINVSSSQGQVWTSLDGYVDEPGNHQIFAGCSSGNNPGDVTGHGTAYQNIVQITITSAGITAADLTSVPTTNMINLDMPNGQQFWLAGASFANFLGGDKFCNPHILINPDNPEMIFVVGASGLYYTLTGGVNPDGPSSVAWQLAGTGVPLSAIAAIAVDPQNDQHVILASADHIQTDLTDPTAWNVAGGDVNAISMPTLFPRSSYPHYTGNESHAVAFDPHSNVYTGMNEKFGKNAGGTVWWRPANSLTTNTTEMGYNAAVATVMRLSSIDDVNAPIGLFAGVDGAETYVVAVSDGAGVYRTWVNTSSLLAGTPSWASWTRVNLAIGTNGGNPGLHCPIVADPSNAGVLYAYDRNKGIYASNSYGQSGSWSLLWSLPSGVHVADGRSGWLAANPQSSAGNIELWLTTSSGAANDAVYKLDGTYNATTGDFTVSATAIGGSNFPYGAAGIAITSAGEVYTPAISGPSSPLVQLFAYPTGGPWTPADDGSIGTYVSWPTCLALSANPYSLPTAGAEILLVASDSDWAVYGTPTA